METPKIFESEYRFCLILWDNEPVSSGRLVQLAKENLGWSKATTYTVIRRLSERGVLKNENTIVSALISKEEAQKYSPILGNAKPLARREETRPPVQDDDDLPEGEFKGF